MAVAYTAAFGGIARSLSPLPSVGDSSSRPTGLNAPLWGLVSLFMAFSLLWTTTAGRVLGLDAPALPLAVPVEAVYPAFVAEHAGAAVDALRRVAAAVPAAQSVVLARFRAGDAGAPWTVLEVDGKTLRMSDADAVEAALAAAGFSLEPGDRIVVVPNTGRQVVQRAVPFLVVDGGMPTSVRAAADTVGEALRLAGVDLHEADHVRPAPETRLLPGVHISITRAQPVAITGPDVLLETRSHATTVGELLAEGGIVLGPLDRVEPALEAPLPPGGTVRVIRVREEDQHEVRLVPFTTRLQISDQLAPGTRYRVQAGVAGMVEHVFRVVFEDDVVVRRTTLRQRVLRDAVDEVVLAGRVPLPPFALPGLPVPFTAAPGQAPPVPVRQVMTMIATAYDPGPISTGKSPGHPAYGITATGVRATYGVAAVDPRVIPFFTRMYVPGYGYAVAADTGGAIKGNRIDVFYPTYNEAIQWGRRVVPVYILE